MITCVANGCSSTQNTRIDDDLITFFPFPEDNLRRNQWLRNCDLIVSDKEPLHLCELHFEKIHFTASKDLKSTAIPTLFSKTEESPKKQKIEHISQTPPLKQKKLDEHSHSLVTPPQSPSMQDNTENLFNSNKTDTTKNSITFINGVNTSTPVTDENSQIKKTYRLIIQIDKIRSKPAPKCKKLPLVIKFHNDIKDSRTNENGPGKKLLPLLLKKPCAKGSCKLKKCTYKSKFAFQCELCDKYYFIKKDEVKSYSCVKCFNTFPDQQSLYTHIRKHFICDICLTECSSQITFDKHIRLHVSTDPLYPYKCHQCLKIFDLKDNIKQHCLQEHPKINLQNTVLQITPSSMNTIVSPQNDYFCVTCNVNFTSDQDYKNHISMHGKKESITCNITGETNNIIPVPNPLTGSQIGILQAVKFSCRLCSKEFDNVGEVDLHTRTHLEIPEESLKCNI